MIYEPDTDKLFLNTNFVVDATYDEYFLLWQKYSKEATFKTELNTYTWEQVNPSYSITIGQIANHPIAVHCWWSVINNVLVMFYEATSRVVDYELVEKWVENRCSPRYDKNTRLAHTNTANFHHCLHFIDGEAKENPQDFLYYGLSH